MGTPPPSAFADVSTSRGPLAAGEAAAAEPWTGREAELWRGGGAAAHAKPWFGSSVAADDAEDPLRFAKICLLPLPGLASLAAFSPGPPPAWSLPLVHGVGVLMVAARVHSTMGRLGVVAEFGESGGATAIRRAMLLGSLLGGVARFLLVLLRGRHFWAAARAQLVNNALVVGVGCLLLRAVESPDAYPPSDVSFGGAMAISASLALYAIALRPAHRQRCAAAKELLVASLVPTLHAARQRLLAQRTAPGEPRSPARKVLRHPLLSLSPTRRPEPAGL